MKDKYKIQIGDILYEDSKMYGKIIKHEIIDIFFEAYLSGWKTIVVTKSFLGRKENFITDVLHWYSDEECKEKLIKE